MTAHSVASSSSQSSGSDWFYLSRSDAPVLCWFPGSAQKPIPPIHPKSRSYTVNPVLQHSGRIVPWFLFFCVAVLIWQLNTTLWLVLATINSIQSSVVHVILTFTLNTSIVRWSWDCSQFSNFSFLKSQGLLAALQYCQRVPSSLLHSWFHWLDSEHLKFNSILSPMIFSSSKMHFFPTSN